MTGKGIALIAGGAAVVAAGAAVLLVTNANKSAARFASPLEYYQYVETKASADAGARLAGPYDAMLRENLDMEDRHIDAEAALTLYAPAAGLLQSYTGRDWSWLETLGLGVDADLTGDGAALSLALSLNGDTLLDAELLSYAVDGTLYGRVPLLSEEYFQTELGEYAEGAGRAKALYEALPEAREWQDLLDRCTAAALAHVEDVEQGSGTLSAGGVSAEYTTLTATLTGEQLHDLTEDVCGVLRENAALAAFVAGLEEYTGEALYGELLSVWETLPDSEGLADGAVMTLYVDGDDAVRGREIEFGENVWRCAAPEKDGRGGFEWFRQDALGADLCDEIAGGWTREGGLYSGGFNVTWDGTEYLTLEVEAFDPDRLAEGEMTGTFTLRPTAEFYKALGVYNLTARTLEDISYVLAAETDSAVLDAYMGGEPFLMLALTADSGPVGAFEIPADAAELGNWATSLVFGGGLGRYMRYLEGTDLPSDVLDELFGLLF